MPARPLSAPADVADAIAAAVAMCWPRAPASTDPGRQAASWRGAGSEHAWRFSGRWWRAPVSLRRDRPWSEGVAMSAVAEVWDLTTVAEDEVVFHLHSPDTLETGGMPGGWPGPGYEVISGLRPGTPVLRHGIGTRTLDAATQASFSAGSPPSTTFISARPSAATSPTSPTPSATSLTGGMDAREMADARAGCRRCSNARAGRGCTRRRRGPRRIPS